MVKRFSFVEAKGESVLLQEGVVADGLYILLSGDARMRQGSKTIAALSTGDIFGEESLLTDEPSLSTIETLTKCWLLKMKKEVFREAIMTYGSLLQVISDELERHTARREKEYKEGSTQGRVKISII